jgi:hypothetical protein
MTGEIDDLDGVHSENCKSQHVHRHQLRASQWRRKACCGIAGVHSKEKEHQRAVDSFGDRVVVHWQRDARIREQREFDDM